MRTAGAVSGAGGAAAPAGPAADQGNHGPYHPQADRGQQQGISNGHPMYLLSERIGDPVICGMDLRPGKAAGQGGLPARPRDRFAIRQRCGAVCGPASFRTGLQSGKTQTQPPTPRRTAWPPRLVCARWTSAPGGWWPPPPHRAYRAA